MRKLIIPLGFSLCLFSSASWGFCQNWTMPTVDFRLGSPQEVQNFMNKVRVVDSIEVTDRIGGRLVKVANPRCLFQTLELMKDLGANVIGVEGKATVTSCSESNSFSHITFTIRRELWYGIKGYGIKENRIECPFAEGQTAPKINEFPRES